MAGGVMDSAVSGHHTGVLADVRGRGVLRDPILDVGAATAVGVAAQVALPVPGSPVPITRQTFAVLLAGAGADRASR